VKRLPPVLGALVLVGAVVAVVVWQRPDAAPPRPPLKDFVVQYADGSPMWSSEDGEPNSALVRQVLAELREQASILPDQLRQAGGVVATTIDPKAQSAGTAVIEGIARAQPGALRYSLTAVDPATGGVVAYLPGDSRDDRTDYAGGVLKEPGSAFFPIGVVAGLQNGIKLDRAFDGTPRVFYGVKVTDKAQCGKPCTVRDALAKSSNVVMYDLVVNEVGIIRTVKAAHQAGVPETVVLNGEGKKLLVGEDGGTPNGGVSLGGTPAAMRPLDLTAVYATFAAGGVQRKAHFIANVTDESGDLLYRAIETTSSAFDADLALSKDISTQVTTVLTESTQCPGVVCRAGEHELDGVTETKHAWTAGYTDRLAVTVMIGNVDAAKPARDAAAAPITGAGLPRRIWQSFVEKV
jgi:membrane peptidoglycan carboxypeptidase